MATVNDHRTLHCPLCFKRFITPRVLPCCHTFCEKCLGEDIESQVQGGTKFMCPLCAMPTLPIDSSLAVEKWASAFPLNTVINSLLVSAEDLDRGDKNCGPCGIDGETKAAEVWCVECREKLCNPCYRSHQRMKPLRHHKTIPVDEMDQHIQANYTFDFDCGCHNEEIKLFCLDHRKLCCCVCVATDHRQCNDVRSIDDITRDQSQMSTFDYPSIIRDFKNLKTGMEKIMTEKKTNAKQVLQEKDQILHDMDNRIDTIIMHLNKLRNTFRNETEQIYIETESFMLENEKKVQSFITNIDNASEILEVLEKSGTLQQKFTTYEHLRCQIMSHYNQLNLRLNDDVEVHFILKASTFLENLEETSKSVGFVAKTSPTSRDVLYDANKILKNLNSRIEIITGMCSAQVEKVEDLMSSPVTYVNGVLRNCLGWNTWLSGGTCLDNGRLLMCDEKNNRLVEINNYYVVRDYSTEGRPSDVAAGNKDNEIYIAVKDGENYIYKCMLYTDLITVGRIKAPSGTRGIAVSGDNIIVSISEAVIILTKDGSTVKYIPTSGYCGLVAVSQTQGTIYHKDGNDVVCRTLEGQEVFKYQHPQLECPCGIFTDKTNVYICGANSHNVHQISCDGQRSKIILHKLHNISRPYYAVLHPKKNHLIVTSFMEKTAYEIYKLE